MALSVAQEQRSSMLATMAQRILFCPAEERTARELSQLQPSERQQVWADMTGSKETNHYRIHAEEPAFVAEKIQQLTREIHRLITQQSSSSTVSDTVQEPHVTSGSSSSSSVDPKSVDALHFALRQNVNYVTHERFLMAFLRADNFDVVAAAKRMCLHFEMKNFLFGANYLTKNITLQDLGSDDLESIKAGGVQMLSSHDHAGRRVIFTRQKSYKYKERKNQLRAFFYLCMACLESPISQKLGIVSISYQVGGGYPEGGYDYELTRLVSQMVKSVPARFAAVYVCFNDSMWKVVAEFISHVVSPLLRVRLRSIQGSHQEVHYKLMALGVPNQAIPVTQTGEPLLFNHLAFLEERARIEALRTHTVDANEPYLGIVGDGDDNIMEDAKSSRMIVDDDSVT